MKNYLGVHADVHTTINILREALRTRSVELRYSRIQDAKRDLDGILKNMQS